VQLLLDGREEAVEIDVEEAEAVGLGRIGHAVTADLHYIRFLFASTGKISPPWEGQTKRYATTKFRDSDFTRRTAEKLRRELQKEAGSLWLAGSRLDLWRGHKPGRFVSHPQIGLDPQL
jgi:hypothetical protein